MSRFPRARNLAVWPVLFALLTVACSRPGTDRAAQNNQHQVPLQDGSADDSSSLGVPLAQGKNLKPESSLPFRDSVGLPAGTLLTVRLKTPISADSPGASGTFDAVVDEPVLVEGTTLLPRGASVAGRVESAHASALRRNRGYVRLTLDSITVGGQELRIQTASLFANGNAGETQSAAGDASPRVVRLESGRRLTFRLTESVLIASQPAMPNH